MACDGDGVESATDMGQVLCEGCPACKPRPAEDDDE